MQLLGNRQIWSVNVVHLVPPQVLEMEHMRVHVYITLVYLQWIYFVQIKDWEHKEANVFEGVHNTDL